MQINESSNGSLTVSMKFAKSKFNNLSRALTVVLAYKSLFVVLFKTEENYNEYCLNYTIKLLSELHKFISNPESDPLFKTRILEFKDKLDNQYDSVTDLPTREEVDLFVGMLVAIEEIGEMISSSSDVEDSQVTPFDPCFVQEGVQTLQ